MGAGLAGLVAGDELSQAGHHVTIFEARPRSGGRVLTLKEPFADGQHAEAGALFVPDSQALTLSYVTRFGLSLEPALPFFEARLFYVRGRRIVSNWGGKAQWPYALAADERMLGRSDLWKNYVEAGLGALDEHALDGMSVADLLRSRGASDEAVALLRVGYLDMMGDGIESYSALQLRQRLAALGGGAERTYVIRGGAELLPRAFAAGLEDRIHYNVKALRIEPGEKSAAVVVDRAGVRERVRADHVICTLPFSVLRHLEISPPFSTAKTRVIKELAYTSVARVFLQFHRKPWTSQNLHLLTTTDLPMQWMFEHTIHQRGPRGVLEAQALGPSARRVTQMAESDRIEFALSQVHQVFPDARKHYDRGVSKCWDEDPWSQGAFAYFRPGQMISFTPNLSREEGRVHFAGDHTSTRPGWMQGALESGLRAAREITAIA